jgi:parvulin-like peptidyl-prolyl isomerase
LLAVGTVLGILLAASGALSPAGDLAPMPDEVIAEVNERTIRTDSYERVRAMVASDKRNPMSDADRAHVLRRLIEEELLIQRGETIGLLDSDPTVRKAIAAAMIQSIVAESESEQPEPEDLRRYYDENLGYFTPPGTLHVRQMLFRPRAGETPEALRERAREARRARSGGMGFAEAREEWADEEFLPIPDTALPANKLRQYVGPSLVEEIRQMRPGEVSQPVASQQGFRLVELVDAQAGAPLDFDEARKQVEVAYRRDAADRALREYLEWLWDEADIRLSPRAPTP